MLTIKNEKLRQLLKIVLPFILIPAAAVLGILLFDGKGYIFVSLFSAVCSLFFFISGFEKKKIGTRRMVITSVMIALSVAGRFIPLFKPITAVTVITAVYIGGEAGFLVGSFSALLSNFYFGQGPWTPFQMLAWGLIGLFAGYFSRYLKKSRTALIAYGVLSGVIFSLIMDVWTVLWYGGGFSLSLFGAAVITALPHTALYAVSNAVFLFFLARPFGEKLERIRIKYGI